MTKYLVEKDGQNLIGKTYQNQTIIKAFEIKGKGGVEVVLEGQTDAVHLSYIDALTIVMEQV